MKSELYWLGYTYMNYFSSLLKAIMVKLIKSQQPNNGSKEKYYIYKISCLKKGFHYGHIYIGKRKSLHPEKDSYTGGGTILKHYQRLYGFDNFKKDILFIFDNEKDALNKEMELVSSVFIARADNFNVSIGGINSRDTHFAHSYKHRIINYIETQRDFLLRISRDKKFDYKPFIKKQWVDKWNKARENTNSSDNYRYCPLINSLKYKNYVQDNIDKTYEMIEL